MDNLKKYAKYIILIIAGFLLTDFLIFIGFNANYSKITLKANVPAQISINKAESNKSQVRIYGHVHNSDENNINGKYIKISVYNAENENIATQYLKIDDVEYGSNKLFKFNFSADEAASYEIDIVDNE